MSVLLQLGSSAPAAALPGQFCDSDGRIGLLDEYCPHRRASRFFGPNEESRLRWVYHGWKFADGSCRLKFPTAMDGVRPDRQVRN
jgi:phenylpropionate dioxygenase-like ring-hydroxylating dioxygenase large terminal subunit